MMLDYFYGSQVNCSPTSAYRKHSFRTAVSGNSLRMPLDTVRHPLDRMSLSAKNSWVDEHGRVYIIYTVREVQESLCCAEHKAVKCSGS